MPTINNSTTNVVVSEGCVTTNGFVAVGCTIEQTCQPGKKREREQDGEGDRVTNTTL